MIILMGKSGAGKDTILNKLLKCGYNKIPTVTTRPPRYNEVNGRSYVFTDERTFRTCIDDGLFAEYKMYHSSFGDWWYGSLKSNYLTAKEKDVIILTPRGYLNLRPFLKKNNIKTKVFYIMSSKEDRKSRLEKRGDDPKEIVRRMRADKEEFIDIEKFSKEISVIVNNTTIDNAVNEIMRIVESEKNE